MRPMTTLGQENHAGSTPLSRASVRRTKNVRNGARIRAMEKRAIHRRRRDLGQRVKAPRRPSVRGTVRAREEAQRPTRRGMNGEEDRQVNDGAVCLHTSDALPSPQKRLALSFAKTCGDSPARGDDSGRYGIHSPTDRGLTSRLSAGWLINVEETEIRIG